MSDTPTPPAPDMQAAIEAAVNERLSALSGRMDRFEREAFSRTVKDGHIDKRIFGQGDSLRTHIGDGLAHTYRDQWLDREILDLERLPEPAAAGFTIDAAMMTWAGSPAVTVGDIPFAVKETETDPAAVKCSAADKGIVAVQGGLYLVHAVVKVTCSFGSDPDAATGGADLLIGQYVRSSGYDLELNGHVGAYDIVSFDVAVNWVGTVPAGAIITLRGTGDTSRASMSYATLSAIRLAE